MAPTSARAVSTLLPHGGTLDSSSAPFFLDDGTNAITASMIVFTIIGILGYIAVPVFILRHPSKPPPLPPTQPLALYRERETKYLPRCYLPHDVLGQDSHNWNKKRSLEPFRMPSIRSTDSSSTPLSTCRSASGPPTLPTTVTASSYPSSDERARTTRQNLSRTHIARSPSLSRSRAGHDISRNTSTTSTRTASANVSMRSVNRIRGAPHSSHNKIEIVLPPPLAPQLQKYMTGDPSVFQSNGWPEHGRPISDRWIKITSSSGSPYTDRNLSVGYASPKRQSQSFPRHYPSPGDPSNLPFHRSASWRSCTPPWDEQPPSPLPPLPQFPRVHLPQLEVVTRADPIQPWDPIIAHPYNNTRRDVVSLHSLWRSSVVISSTSERNTDRVSPCSDISSGS